MRNCAPSFRKRKPNTGPRCRSRAKSGRKAVRGRRRRIRRVPGAQVKGRAERYIEAATEKRAVEGAELEFNQACSIGAHKFPLEILAPVEERATTNTDTAVITNRWLDRLFSESAAARLGITFESVPAGMKSYPIILTGASGAQRGRKKRRQSRHGPLALPS